MLEKFLEILKTTPTIYGAIGVVVGIIAYILVEKGTEPVIRLVDSIVVQAENSFNSGEGKKKLEFAVEQLEKYKSTLPWYVLLLLSPVLNKRNMVNLIEKSLNRISVAFGAGRKVDVKGNEE